jgi:hypothetical protein
MATSPCPECGQSTPAEASACPNCGHALSNGAVPQGKLPSASAAPPTEVGSLVIKTPPEIMDEARRTFNQEEFLEGAREIERTGGYKLEDFIDELEEEVRRRE